MYSLLRIQFDDVAGGLFLRRTFVKKSVQQIFDTVLNDYPGNVIKKKLNPRNKSTIPYVVQYDETNFEFISRLAAEYGEWLYYDGQEIILGIQVIKRKLILLLMGISHSICNQPDACQVQSDGLRLYEGPVL